MYSLYIIFHKNIYEKCYKDLSSHNLEKLNFFAVNSKIQKEVPIKFMNQLIIERNLRNYNPLLQMCNFCEDSVFLHLLKNKELMEKEYIGFFQYDMILQNSLFETIDNTLQENNQPTLFYFYKENSYRHLDQCICLKGWEIIVNIYNSIFETNHTIEFVIQNDIPLYHTYVLPTHIFIKMMCFFEKVYVVLIELLGNETRHLPYHFERCHGIFLLFQKVEKHLAWIQLPGITHSDTLKDTWQNSA